jgi:orotidine-5'-phosphate decarboxylase
MESSAQKAESNIILALDFPYTEKHEQLLSRSLKILESVSPHLCAVKMNRQLALPLGLFNGVQTIVIRAHDLGLPTIMDAKINDIGNTNRAIAEYYYKAGFDAVIVSPFVGWEEGSQPIFEVAKKMSRGVIVLVYMSHKGAVEGYGQMVQDSTTKRLVPQYRIFAEKALKWNADGAVVGATYPDRIREIHALLKAKVPIYSPGVGAQGGDVEAAVKAGAQYLIVGRTIVEAKNPEKTAEQIRDAAWQSVKQSA